MLITLVSLSLAAPPAAPAKKDATTKAAATKTATREAPAAIEGGLVVTVPVPSAGLGPGVGLRLLGEAAIVPRLTLGGELFGRFPGAASGTLKDDALTTDLDWRSELTVLGGGARVAYAIGPASAVHGRVGLAAGVAWVAQDTHTEVGVTHDATLTGWVEPQVGGVFPLGPGALTADLLVPIAPARLLVLGDVPGGTGVALAIGYRYGFGGG